MRVLLVEPYFAGSHRAWAEGYQRHSRHTVDLLTLPGRFWKWRMQGAALTLAEAAAQRPAPDVLLVTDMLHLPAFIGLARHHLGHCPAVLYMHENQLTYPWPPGERIDLTYALTNWLSMAAADRVLFNSRFHLASWFAALPNLLKHFPDASHLHRVEEVKARADVLPVGVDLGALEAVPRQPQTRPTIVWNQRWEYDKGPEDFFAALDSVTDLDWQLILAGESFRVSPAEFEDAPRRYDGRVIHRGFAPDDRYRRLLRRADIHVSTARHEFFGVAAVEAAYAGAYPLVPARLSYPELFPPEYLYQDADELSARLRLLLATRPPVANLAAELRRFDWSAVAPAYDAALERVGAAGAG
jgi:glycosyltransferase involved in cell wall biosynthesis